MASDLADDSFVDARVVADVADDDAPGSPKLEPPSPLAPGSGSRSRAEHLLRVESIARGSDASSWGEERERARTSRSERAEALLRGARRDSDTPSDLDSPSDELDELDAEFLRVGRGTATSRLRRSLCPRRGSNTRTLVSPVSTVRRRQPRRSRSRGDSTRRRCSARGGARSVDARSRRRVTHRVNFGKGSGDDEPEETRRRARAPRHERRTRTRSRDASTSDGGAPFGAAGRDRGVRHRGRTERVESLRRASRRRG